MSSPVRALAALAVGAVVLASATACCTTPLRASSLPPGAAGVAAWRNARAQVEQLRDRYTADAPYSMNVALELTQLQLGQRMRARGTVAVQPPDALRMILLGPGGTTALDLWICGDRYRLAVPALEMVRRGDRHTPIEQQRGLPVAFLRWWFLRPLQGRLLSAHERRDEQGLMHHFVLRDDEAVVHLQQFAGSAATPTTAPLRVRRLARGDEERLVAHGPRCGQVRYTQRSTGLAIEVECEQVNSRPPPARAFAVPDAPHQPCGEADG